MKPTAFPSILQTSGKRFPIAEEIMVTSPDSRTQWLNALLATGVSITVLGCHATASYEPAEVPFLPPAPVSYVPASYSADAVPTHDLAAAYDINESATVSDLGVDVSVSLSQIGGSFNAFVVRASYLEPGYAPSNRRQALARTVIAAPCDAGLTTSHEKSFTFSNAAGSEFILQFTQRCKRGSTGLLIPYLQASIGCTNLAFERNRAAAIKDGVLFDIVASGYMIQPNPSPYHDVIEFASDTYEVASSFLTVLDIVSLVSGQLTVGKFVIKMIEGEVQDAAVNAAFKYLEDATEEKAYFKHTGWHIRCRICGNTFHRSHLEDGEILQCTKSGCRARVQVHFH